jgi:hypothetical protein
MKLNIAFLALATFVSTVFGAPNELKTATPSGICKNARIRSNGTQIRAGFCSSTIQGQIPSFDRMTSTLIIFPKNGQTIKANKNFTAKVAIENLKTGFFSDAVNDYYDAAQKLQGGIITGHCHITIQQIKNFNKPLDARIFAFFKGLNFAAKKGILEQVVGTEKSAGLGPGTYRMCTMSSSFTHQPVVMPVAQRGAQDDCIRFNVKK